MVENMRFFFTCPKGKRDDGACVHSHCALTWKLMRVRMRDANANAYGCVRANILHEPAFCG